MKKDRATRREILKNAMAASAAIFPLPGFFPSPALAQSAKARVVVIGGGFGGATCARALKRADPKLAVTLVEPNRVYTACPMSNAAIAGLRELTLQEFRYNHIAAEGIEIVYAAAETIESGAQAVTVGGGRRLEYDRLVLAPGIDFLWDALPGYSREAATSMPHAWIGGDQIALLARQVASMDDGGVVVISVPVTPARCPPAPYERASLIAH
jgi:sulfide dehydrogenase [flavocytochrome c] flavoprotein chain